MSIDFLLEHKHLCEEYLQPLSKMIEEGGADVGKVLLGEFCPMRTLPTSVLPSSSRSFCRCLEKVSIDFLLEHKHLGEEYLQPLSKMIEEGGADVGKEDLAHIGPTFFL